MTNAIGPDKPRKRAPRRPPVTLKCARCESAFTVKGVRAEKAKFCSQACMGEQQATQASAALTCPQCQKVFSRPKSVAARTIYCSHKCQGAAKTESAKVMLTCAACNKPFSHPACRAKKTTYCSKKCAAQARVAKLDLKPNAVCAHCSTSFRVKPSQLNRSRATGIYCSFACHIAQRIATRSKK